MDPKILQNIEQQSKRLLDQLKELEELKAELEPEEYNEMKKDTLEQLQIFQSKLLEIQSGDLSLQSAVQKQFEAIRQAVKSSFNADEIKKLMSSSQGQGIRDKILKLSQEFNLQRIDKVSYVQQTLTCINQLQDMGVELKPDEQSFLQEHTGKQNFIAQQGNVQGQKILQTADQQLQENQLKK